MRAYRPRRGKESLWKKRKRHGPDEIIKKLRDAEMAAGQGEDLAKILQRLEVSEQTYYRWKQQYGGMKAPDAKGRRRAADHLEESFGASERRSCKVVSQHRTTQRYRAITPDDEKQLVKHLLNFARTHPRYGYRRITAQGRASPSCLDLRFCVRPNG